MDVPDLYSAIVDEPVPDGLSEVVHLEEIYKKWQHQQQEQIRLLDTIRDLAEENKRILKERDDLRDECHALKKRNAVYKKNAQLIFSVCRVEIGKRERKVAELIQKGMVKNSNHGIGETVPSDNDEEYSANVPLNLDTELKYTGILTELNNDANAAASQMSSKASHHKNSSHFRGNRDTPFDCRPFKGPKTPPTPNCLKLNAAKARAISSERQDRKREARVAWDDNLNSRSKHCRVDDYDGVEEYFEKGSRNGRMEYCRGYSSERKYGRRDGYATDHSRSSFPRHKRSCDEDGAAFHSSGRSSYSQSARHFERDSYEDEEYYDHTRASEDHYRRDWNGNEYRRSRDSACYPRGSSRDRVRKMDYDEDEGFHDHRRRYSRRYYDYEPEANCQDVDNGYRSRKTRDEYYSSDARNAERHRNEDRRSDDRHESHRFEGYEQTRHSGSSGYSDKRPPTRVSDPNNEEMRSSCSSSQADRSLDRSINDDHELLRAVSGGAEPKMNDSKCIVPDLEPPASNSDQVLPEFESKESPVPPSKQNACVKLTDPVLVTASIASPSPEASADEAEAPPSARPVENDDNATARDIPVPSCSSPETPTKSANTPPKVVTSPESKKQPDACSLTLAESKLRRVKESKPILFTKVKDASKTEHIEYIKSSLSCSFRGDVSRYTSKQIHIKSHKEGHPPAQFAKLEGLRIQKAEEEAALMDHFVLGSELKSAKSAHTSKKPTESVFSRRMKEKMQREKELAEKMAAARPIPSAGATEDGEDVALDSEVLKKESEPEPDASDASPQLVTKSPPSPGLDPECASPKDAVDDDDDFDVTASFECDPKSPESAKKSEAGSPFDDCELDQSTSHSMSSNCKSASVSESFEERRKSCDSEDLEVNKVNDAVDNNDIESVSVEVVADKADPPLETLEWDCEVDFHLEEVDTTHVATENVSEDAPQSPNSDKDAEELEPGEVEEGEILDDSDAEGGKADAGKPAKKKLRPSRKAKRVKGKPKEKGKGNKATKGVKGVKTAKLRTDSKPDEREGIAKLKKHVKKRNGSLMEEPLKKVPRSRDTRIVRVGHYDTEAMNRCRSGSNFTATRHHNSEKYSDRDISNERRPPMKRQARSLGSAPRRDAAVKEVKRFHGRVPQDGAALYHSSNSTQRGSLSSNIRHYDIPDRRFRRK